MCVRACGWGANWQFWEKFGEDFYDKSEYDGMCKVGLLKESFHDLQVWHL